MYYARIILVFGLTQLASSIPFFFIVDSIDKARKRVGISIWKNITRKYQLSLGVGGTCTRRMVVRSIKDASYSEEVACKIEESEANKFLDIFRNLSSRNFISNKTGTKQADRFTHRSVTIDASRRDGFRCRRSHSHSLSGPFLAPEFSSIFNEKTVHCPTDVPLIARRAKIRGQSSDEMVHRLVVAFLARYRADNWHKVRQIRQTWTSSFCRARFHLTCRSIIHGFNYTEDGIRGTCLA